MRNRIVALALAGAAALFGSGGTAHAESPVACVTVGSQVCLVRFAVGANFVPGQEPIDHIPQICAVVICAGPTPLVYDVPEPVLNVVLWTGGTCYYVTASGVSTQPSASPSTCPA